MAVMTLGLSMPTELPKHVKKLAASDGSVPYRVCKKYYVNKYYVNTRGAQILGRWLYFSKVRRKPSYVCCVSVSAITVSCICTTFRPCHCVYWYNIFVTQITRVTFWPWLWYTTLLRMKNMLLCAPRHMRIQSLDLLTSEHCQEHCRNSVK